jgi:hypothetical protein
MIEQYVANLLTELVKLAPRIAGALIVLVVGWAAGRLTGRGLSKILDKAGLDEALRRTAIGKALDRTRITIVGFFDLVIRWFVYLVAILAAVDILQISILSNFISQIVQYLPRFIAGVFILLIGFIVADFVADALRAVGKEGRLEYAPIFADALRFVFYFVVLAIGLSTMQVDISVLYIFANALAWGIALGVAVGLGIAFGWGFKDAIAKRADKWIEVISTGTKKKNSEQSNA